MALVKAGSCLYRLSSEGLAEKYTGAVGWTEGHHPLVEPARKVDSLHLGLSPPAGAAAPHLDVYSGLEAEMEDPSSFACNERGTRFDLNLPLCGEIRRRVSAGLG